MSVITSSQPRKRVEQACDQCRRRKTKCDGGFECLKCSSIGLRCSYGQRTKQLSGQRYVAHLEHKLESLETRIRKLSSSVDATDLDDLQKSPDKARSELSVSSAGVGVDPTLAISRDESHSSNLFQSSCGHTGTDVETLNYDLRRKNANVGGEAPVYRGQTTGLEVLRGLRCLCDFLVDPTLDPDRTATQMVASLNSTPPNQQLSISSSPNLHFLSEASVHKWVHLAFDEAFVLWPFIDRHAFEAYAQHIIDRGSFSDEDNNSDHLGLFHAVIALGQRHDPDLIGHRDSVSKHPETRGFQSFAAARDLVPLTDCSRNMTAVQTVLCMALYLMSVSAKSKAHTYIGIAGNAAHQIGSHQASHALYLSEKEKVLSQRLYITTRMLDAYITSSLGLPRNFRAVEASVETTAAPYVHDNAMLAVASANIELLEIMSNAREKMYFADTLSRVEGRSVIALDQLDQLSKTLDQWASRYNVSGPTSDNSFSDCAKASIFLKYSQCFVLLTLYSPILHHVVKPHTGRESNAYAHGWKCVDAAIQAICIAETMAERDMLNEAYALTVDVLVMAATSLLVVELGAHDDGVIDRVGKSSRKARQLLEILSQKSCSAAGCLESLKPLYESAARASGSSNGSAEILPQDHDSSPKAVSDIMVWEPPFDADSVDTEFDPASFDMMVTNLLDDSFEPLLPPVEWASDWAHGGWRDPAFTPLTVDHGNTI